PAPVEQQATCQCGANARSAAVSRTCEPAPGPAPRGDPALPSQPGGPPLQSARPPRAPRPAPARSPRLARAAAPSHAHVEGAALAGLVVTVRRRVVGGRCGLGSRRLAAAARAALAPARARIHRLAAADPRHLARRRDRRHAVDRLAHGVPAPAARAAAARYTGSVLLR